MGRNAPRITLKAVHYALKNLHDPMALRRSPLVDLPQVEVLASHYQSGRWARAYALRDLLRSTCGEILDLDDQSPQAQRVLTFLRLYMEEPNVSAIARQLALSRQTVYDCVMPKALELVVEGLQGADSRVTARAS